MPQISIETNLWRKKSYRHYHRYYFDVTAFNRLRSEWIMYTGGHEYQYDTWEQEDQPEFSVWDCCYLFLCSFWASGVSIHWTALFVILNVFELCPSENLQLKNQYFLFVWHFCLHDIAMGMGFYEIPTTMYVCPPMRHVKCPMIHGQPRRHTYMTKIFSNAPPWYQKIRGRNRMLHG